jgi:hypothetical protein
MHTVGKSPKMVPYASPTSALAFHRSPTSEICAARSCEQKKRLETIKSEYDRGKPNRFLMLSEMRPARRDVSVVVLLQERKNKAATHR